MKKLGKKKKLKYPAKPVCSGYEMGLVFIFVPIPCNFFLCVFGPFSSSRQTPCIFLFYCCYFPVPEEFSFDPVSRTYGNPQRRPEVRSSTIEFIAPSEYMVNWILIKDTSGIVVIVLSPHKREFIFYK